ncbi:Nif3-like dinuclear metal center hexameric protein [Corynebacterium sp. zg254]|uniref:GTP cyclohydrolase 1 type 2 homolog n=1 Tax=Corynebacterium zhongnanshanii TaxID=2768834 RepID=A0ABQ6VDL4_9CORY|nr:MULTISPECIES: Nif3-like dinuclear metal center hexameric protein [Corynebacterium]KAB3520876.1 Nif3-like dinuclear metal center hexameric protein [Corynebacterium zhongnanshanii]MCR5914504.1 Nif3-like dinuclear metal center hexameric protein [Corynebacterium sp. zg254]
MVTVADVVSVLEEAYPPRLAESWDAVGLICGDPKEPADKVAFALDCTDAVVDEAIDSEATMLVVHHPLLLRGVTAVPADSPKGRIIHKLIRHKIALFAAHTNADSARPGVNDRLAELLGVTPGPALRPIEGERSASGEDLGIGRVGELDTPMTLAEFARRVEQRLPKTQWGIRAAGDPEAMIRTVAVASGAGDSFLQQVAGMDVDCFVTSDLRHHPVDEHLRMGGCPVIDTAHWASEFPWCEQAADVVAKGTGAQARVIGLCTDPWTIHQP